MGGETTTNGANSQGQINKGYGGQGVMVTVISIDSAIAWYGVYGVTLKSEAIIGIHFFL